MRITEGSSEGGKHFLPVTENYPGPAGGPGSYRTQAWCAVTVARGTLNGTSPGLQAQPGKCGPQTKDTPPDPHHPGTQMACCQVLWHTRGDRCTTGPVGCGPSQKGSCAVGKGFLRNHKMRSYRPHTSSETRFPTNRARLQGCHSSARRPSRRCGRVWDHPGKVACAWRKQFAGKKAWHPDHPGALTACQSATGRSATGVGERCCAGPSTWAHDMSVIKKGARL